MSTNKITKLLTYWVKPNYISLYFLSRIRKTDGRTQEVADVNKKNYWTTKQKLTLLWKMFKRRFYVWIYFVVKSFIFKFRTKTEKTNIAYHLSYSFMWWARPNISNNLFFSKERHRDHRTTATLSSLLPLDGELTIACVHIILSITIRGYPLPIK